MKRFVCFLIAIFMLCITSCNKEIVDEAFKKDEFSIVLDSSFDEKTASGAYAYFISSDYLVVCVKDLFSSFDYAYEGYSEEQYAEVVCKSNDKSTDCIKKDMGFIYLEYTAEAKNKEYYYNSYIKKGKDAFYIITFTAKSKDDNSSENAKFMHWMSTVSVD